MRFKLIVFVLALLVKLKHNVCATTPILSPEEARLWLQLTQTLQHLTPELEAGNDRMLGDDPTAANGNSKSTTGGIHTSRSHSELQLKAENGSKLDENVKLQASNEGQKDDYYKIARERSKEERLNFIKSQIMSFMGWSQEEIDRQQKQQEASSPSSAMPKTNLSIAQQREYFRILYDNAKKIPDWPSEFYGKKTQSLFPSCSLPRHTNKEEWVASTDLNLFFNLSIPKGESRMSAIAFAQLRLYKLSHQVGTIDEGDASDSFSMSEPSETGISPTMLEMALQRNARIGKNVAAAALSAAVAQDKQIRISVYFYTRSRKRKRVKRMLLDSRMQAAVGEQWTEWNVKKAVATWHNDPLKNFGLSVEVEDEEGNTLPAHKFFATVNCSKNIVFPRTLPGFLLDTARDAGVNPHLSQLSNQSQEWSNLKSMQYPTLEYTTEEIPNTWRTNDGVLYTYAKSAFEQRVSNAATAAQERLQEEDSMEGEEQQQQHRIRHDHQRKQQTAAVASDSISVAATPTSTAQANATVV